LEANENEYPAYEDEQGNLMAVTLNPKTKKFEFIKSADV